jgi:dTDP-4-dehydrorhamnose 3,5-epimerase-like enzyme
MERRAPYEAHSDARGTFRGLTREAWAEVNFIETGAGQVRGNHFHAETRELFFIVRGEVRVEVEHLGTGDRTEFTARAGDIFVIEPMELHVFRTLTDAQWINMLSRPMDPDRPDLHRRAAEPR